MIDDTENTKPELAPQEIDSHTFGQFRKAVEAHRDAVNAAVRADAVKAGLMASEDDDLMEALKKEAERIGFK